ncbi:MAG: hypothetical protein ACPG49_06410 [Chitinophagales bacterium]
MSNIKCRNCGETIQSENINIQKALAKCQTCDCVFNINDQILIPRPEIRMPDKFEVLRLRNSLNISYKWFSPVYIFLIFFAIFWNGFMAFWYYTAITEGIWMMGLFGLIHLGVGLFLIYFIIAGFFNSTHINATKNRLKIKHKPIWWIGNKEVIISHIAQLFCKEEVTKGKNGKSYTYHLYMVDVADEHIKLLSNLETPEYALYLEQELEHFLGIENRRVSGEYLE